MELGQRGPSPDRHTAGLADVAFKIGNSLDEFEAVKRELEAAGFVILFELDHKFSAGMHIHDPDGNEVELFVDTPNAEKRTSDAADTRSHRSRRSQE